MDFLPGLLRDAREWWPTPTQFTGASTVALITAGLLTVWGRLYARMLRAEANAAALVVAAALRTATDQSAEEMAERIRAEAVLAAALVKAEAELARDAAQRA